MGDRAEKSSAPTAPLESAWWEDGQAAPLPTDDVPILAPYEKTEPGFELLEARAVAGGRGLETFPVDQDGCIRVALWNADPVRQRIDDMQRALGPLDDEARLLRLQAAALERCYWTFPGNVDLVLDGIGQGRVNLDEGISCQPPWTTLLAVLRRRRNHPLAGLGIAPLHHQQACAPQDDARQKLIRAYVTILTWWCAEGRPDILKGELAAHAELAETIYRRLGPATRLKQLYVHKLIWNLSFWAYPHVPGGRPWGEFFAFGNVYDEAIRDELGGRKDVVSPLIASNNNYGTCHHAFFRHVDHVIAHIGAGRSVVLPGAGRERERIESVVTNYVHAMGSWLAGREEDEAVAIWPPGGDTVRRVYSLVGGATPVKRWLVACLWKDLQDRQADCGRGELDVSPARFAIPMDALHA